MKKEFSVLLSLVIISLGGRLVSGKGHKSGRTTWSDTSAHEHAVASQLAPWNNSGARTSPATVRGISKKERTIHSPDRMLLARITTYGYVVSLGGGVTTHTSESTIQICTSDNKIIVSRSFMTRSHTTGITIEDARWTKDSQFLVLSGTIQSGHQPGHVPTYFFSRKAGKICALDPRVGIWVTSRFILTPHDSVTVRVRERLPGGGFTDNAVKTVDLRSLTVKR